MNKKGITLYELLIAMAIIGLTAVLVVPSLGAMVQRYRLKASAREISQFLLKARTEAVKNANYYKPIFYRVVFNTDKRTYYMEKYEKTSSGTDTWQLVGMEFKLPANITIAELVNANKYPLTEKDYYYFRPDGSMVCDTQILGNKGWVPEDGFENPVPVVSKIKLKNAKNNQYQVSLYSETGLTEVQEGWK